MVNTGQKLGWHEKQACLYQPLGVKSVCLHLSLFETDLFDLALISTHYTPTHLPILHILVPFQVSTEVLQQSLDLFKKHCPEYVAWQKNKQELRCWEVHHLGWDELIWCKAPWPNSSRHFRDMQDHAGWISILVSQTYFAVLFERFRQVRSAELWAGLVWDDSQQKQVKDVKGHSEIFSRAFGG